MLSRIAAQSVAGSGPWGALRPFTAARMMCSGPPPSEAKKNKVTLLGKNNPDSVFYVGPERDLVNFPRRTRPIDAPPVRLAFIPEEWFLQFHSKTGVTGPYMFIASVGTFLISKEYYVLEHEFYTGVGLFILVAGACNMVGPSLRQYLSTTMDKNEAQLKAIRQVDILSSMHFSIIFSNPYATNQIVVIHFGCVSLVF